MPAGNDLTQRELIARAFAGDNVAAEFEADKEAEAERELPKIEAPSVLPGWGAWASNQKEPKWLAAAKLKVERYLIASNCDVPHLFTYPCDDDHQKYMIIFESREAQAVSSGEGRKRRPGQGGKTQSSRQ